MKLPWCLWSKLSNCFESGFLCKRVSQSESKDIRDVSLSYPFLSFFGGLIWNQLVLCRIKMVFWVYAQIRLYFTVLCDLTTLIHQWSLKKSHMIWNNMTVKASAFGKENEKMIVFNCKIQQRHYLCCCPYQDSQDDSCYHTRAVHDDKQPDINVSLPLRLKSIIHWQLRHAFMLSEQCENIFSPVQPWTAQSLEGMWEWRPAGWRVRDTPGAWQEERDCRVINGWARPTVYAQLISEWWG